MASYSFSSREIAETLADVGRKAMAGALLSQEPTGRETIFVKTPLGGIAARSGDFCTAEDCTRVYLSSLEFSENSALTVPVVNTTEELVEGEIYISVTRVGVYWVFDGGGGGNLKHVKSPSAGITGTQSGTYGDGMHSATCTVRVQDSGTQISASYIDKVPAETVDVWNPNPDKILGNVDFVAMYDGEYWFALLPNSSGRIYLTPAAGIAARTGTTAGSATCTIVNTNGPNMSVSSDTQTVYNIFGSAIGGDVYITAKRNDNGDWIADAEDC